jgi:hypothetical protein
MAITAFKTFAAFEVLTASDLNASFAQIINNPIDLWSPMTKNAAAGGFKFTGLGVGGAAGEALTYGAEAFVIGTTSAGTLTINGNAVSVPNGLNFDVNTLVIDATNNRVGIGIASPTVKLEVAGSLGNYQFAATGNRLTLTRNGANFVNCAGASGSINYAAATHSFYDETEATIRTQIDSTGVYPGVDNTVSLGKSGNKWSDVRTVLLTATGAVTLGDAAADTITVTGTPAGQVAASTYTPTLTNVTNVAASTSSLMNYYRIGYQVTVYGRVTIDPTAGSTATVLDISIPISSNFANTTDAHGTGVKMVTTGTNLSAYVIANTTDDRVILTFFNDADISNLSWAVHFSYKII